MLISRKKRRLYWVQPYVRMNHVVSEPFLLPRNCHRVTQHLITLPNEQERYKLLLFFFSSSSFFFFFYWHYSPLWALACRTMSFHVFPSATNSLHLLTPSTWRSLSASSFHLSLGLPLLLVPSSPRMKIILPILSPSILSRWPTQLVIINALCKVMVHQFGHLPRAVPVCTVSKT